MSAIATLNELHDVVRAMEDTFTIKGITDDLRANHCVDWAAVKNEAKDRGISDSVSLDKNLFRTLFSWACSPEARRRGGGRHSTTFRAKAALARQVRAAAAAFSADLDDDTATAVATRDVTRRFRVKASLTTSAPAAADHFTGFVTRLVRRVVRGMRRRTTATNTSDDGDGVTERTVEEGCKEFTEEIEEVAVATATAPVFDGGRCEIDNENADANVDANTSYECMNRGEPAAVL
jgi:hypothetical protein